MAKSKKGSWIVRMERTALIEVICEGCTEEQAREDPWKYAVDEREVMGIDDEVTSVEPNV